MRKCMIFVPTMRYKSCLPALAYIQANWDTWWAAQALEALPGDRIFQETWSCDLYGNGNIIFTL